MTNPFLSGIMIPKTTDLEELYGTMEQTFSNGLKQGISIALGYLSVSFSFGILGVQSGLTSAQTVLISVSNLTSAGQVAGVNLIANGGSYLEIFLAELTVNIRYALMALALSQKADANFNPLGRLLVAFGITDEIFAVASVQKELLKPAFMYGLILIAFLGWVFGTWLGAIAGSWLPEQLTNVLSVSLYGMFLAIIIPPSKKSHGILAVVACAAGISMLLYYLVKSISGGFAMMIASVIAAAMGAWLFPVKKEDDRQ